VAQEASTTQSRAVVPATQPGESLRAAYSRPPSEWPAAEIDPTVKHVELGLLPTVTHPQDNPFSQEKVALGRELFFEKDLSGSRQWACASCHVPELGWSDGQTLSFGHDRQRVKRNSPTIMNAAHKPALFHDGRAATLEEQVIGPILAADEMKGDPEEIVKRLKNNPEYPSKFEQVFGADAITMENVAKAIACFERSIVGGRSRFDQFLKGKSEALSDEALRGLHLFRTKAGCINCHNGPNFSDGKFHDVGLSYYGRRLQDLGRYEISKDPKDVGAFLTPTLRNIERTAPYMHNGLFELDGVINLYNAGMPTLRRKPHQMDDPLFPTKSHLLKPLNLTAEERADLKAFMLSLTEPKQRVLVIPDRPTTDEAAGSKDE
jgi:cytochrome c peroxidase